MPRGRTWTVHGGENPRTGDRGVAVPTAPALVGVNHRIEPDDPDLATPHASVADHTIAADFNVAPVRMVGPVR